MALYPSPIQFLKFVVLKNRLDEEPRDVILTIL